MTGYRSLILLLLSLGFFTASAWASMTENTPASHPDDTADKESRSVAARVNGSPINEDDVARLAKMNFRKFQRFRSDGPTPELQADLRKQAIQNLIAVELLSQAGQKLDIPDLDERIEKSLKEKKIAQVEQSGDRSDSAVRESVRHAILVAEYLKHAGVTDPEIPEARIRDYYEKNKENYRRGDSVHLRHILVQVNKDAGPEERAKARKKIESAKKDIIKGKDFIEAAKEYSEDNAASAGGDIGYIQRGYMPPECDEVAFTIEKNKLSSVIETNFGFHIMEVLDRIPAGIPAYEELKDFFEKYLKIRESKRKKAALIEELRAKAKIEIIDKK